MTKFGDRWAPIYINGIKRMATIGLCWENSFDGLFYADTDDLPLRRCGRHQLPAGSTDHMECCCNPHHMEPVTVRENTLRGVATLFK